MIDSSSLRAVLKEVYGIEDRYLVPMDSSWYVPTYDRNDEVGTWIGYRILSVKPNVRAGYAGTGYSKSVKGRFRLAFVGPQAEALALQTLMFDERADVVSAFEKYQIQLNYVAREVLTYPIKESGLNDSLVWFVDFDCQSFYNVVWKGKEWGAKGDPGPEPWIPASAQGHASDKLESGTMIIKG